jgi:hypothetical protein
VTSHDPHPDRARPPGESQPTSTEPDAQARKDAAAGEPRPAQHSPAAGGASGQSARSPGGLGLVEASLGGLLVLAGVHGGDALLATLAYRLASYWLPLCAGPPAYLLYRHRYGRRAPQSRH